MTVYGAGRGVWPPPVLVGHWQLPAASVVLWGRVWRHAGPEWRRGQLWQVCPLDVPQIFVSKGNWFDNVKDLFLVPCSVNCDSDLVVFCEHLLWTVFVYFRYFSLQASHPVGFGDKTRFEIEGNICREGGPLPSCFAITHHIAYCSMKKVAFCVVEKIDPVAFIIMRIIQLNLSKAFYTGKIAECEIHMNLILHKIFMWISHNFNLLWNLCGKYMWNSCENKISWEIHIKICTWIHFYVTCTYFMGKFTSRILLCIYWSFHTQS